ncbi:MAG: 23S rRNA (uracil(1939)-C(5))-methyltransferase RlmD [Peptoniphilus sp.]|nr:23S rRNA (uracil(1939)-C(5))-methyltransferase RlmD [Peptoniphilus sp.]
MRKNKTIEGIISEVDFPNKSYVVEKEDKIAMKGGLLGQKVEFKKTRKTKGNILRVLERSHLEDGEFCPHLEECGGCTYQSMTYERESKYKKMLIDKLFEEELNIKGVEYLPSPFYKGYRNKMEYTFSDEYKDGPLSLGLHKKNRFYEVVNTDHCNIVHEDFNKIRAFTRDYFDGKLKPYHKIRHTGHLRHLLIRRNLEGEILVNLVTTWAEADYREYFDKLQNLPIEGEIVGIIHTLNDSSADAIIPEKTELIYGRDYLTEKIEGLEFKISLYSFFQTNTHSAKVLYKLAKDTIGNIEDMNLLDLYSGTGTITQIIGQKSKRALGIEIVEEAVESARENAKMNGLNNVQFICGDVFEETKNLDYKPDVVIIDPPREGINPRAIDKIIDFAVENYLYISCNPITLVRDLKIFMERGYKIKELKILDQFPRTYHVETVVLMSRE